MSCQWRAARLRYEVLCPQGEGTSPYLCGITEEVTHNHFSSSWYKISRAIYVLPGWAIGNIDMDDYYLRIISVKLKVVTVNVEYRYTTSFIADTETH